MAEPRQVVRVLQDVVAYCFADVRAEEGRELVLLTRTGAWSYSLLRDGYRGNVARLVTEDLLYDVPDPRELPYWSYVLDSEGTASDRVLLPGRDGYSVWRKLPPIHNQRLSSLAQSPSNSPPLPSASP